MQTYRQTRAELPPPLEHQPKQSKFVYYTNSFAYSYANSRTYFSSWTEIQWLRWRKIQERLQKWRVNVQIYI